MVGDGADGARPVSVVLVDDHQMFVESLVRLLTGIDGIRVVATAMTGAAGLDAVRSHRPDVVLMDHQLPDGLGTDIAAEIVANQPLTRVVMLTAVAEGDVVAAAISAGCSGYVTKHRPVDDVVTAIRMAHKGEIVMPPPEPAQPRPRLGPKEEDAEPPVSKRELEVLQLMAEGLTTAAIAQQLYVSNHTVRNHVQHLLAKLGAHSKLEAVAIAVRSGLIYYR